MNSLLLHLTLKVRLRYQPGIAIVRIFHIFNLLNQTYRHAPSNGRQFRKHPMGTTSTPSFLLYAKGAAPHHIWFHFCGGNGKQIRWMRSSFQKKHIISWWSYQDFDDDLGTYWMMGLANVIAGAAKPPRLLLFHPCCSCLRPVRRRRNFFRCLFGQLIQPA